MMRVHPIMTRPGSFVLRRVGQLGHRLAHGRNGPRCIRHAGSRREPDVIAPHRTTRVRRNDPGWLRSEFWRSVP
jgi:hypothetical protein